MDFVDPVTADFPSRNILPEEDEAAYALRMEEQYLSSPAIKCDPTFLENLPSQRTVVLLCGKVGSCLESILVDGACQGEISQNKISHNSLESGSSHRGRKMISKIYKGLYSTLVISIEDTPAQEQAMVWVDTVLDLCKPTSVIVVGSCPGYRYKGEFDGSEADQIFYMETQSKQGAHRCKPLPTGNLLCGIEGATMLYCELENIRGSAIIAIELSQCPRYDLACDLAEIVMSEMGEHQLHEDAKDCIKRVTMRKYATSAELSVYV